MDSLLYSDCAAVRYASYLAVGIGAYKLLCLLYAVAYFVYRYGFMKRLDLASRYGKGSWAVVTGATAGIGLEFCH